jgi:hypothetical protein
MDDRPMIDLPAPTDALRQATTFPHSTPEDVREWLGILTLSTTILQTHGSRLPQSERRAQWEMMQDAGARLAAAMSTRR